AARRELAEWETCHSTRRRRRKVADRGIHDRMVEAILCNAIHCDLATPDTAIVVSLGRQRRSRYEPAPYAPMWTLLSALGQTGIGLLKVEKGSRNEDGPGRRTIFAASRRLIDLARGITLADIGRRAGGEPIVLRQPRSRLADNPEVGDWFAEWAQSGTEVGDLISYADNPITDQLRREMNAINHALDEANIGWWNGDNGMLPDVGDRWLYRMFNNG